MMLLLDIGNTRIKWASWDGQFRYHEALAHDGAPAALIEQKTWPRAGSVWISAVPRLCDETALTAAVQRACGFAPRFARSAGEWRGLRSAYAQPEKLGVDRWLAMIALWQLETSAFCVISAGTALTFDRVSAQGQHLGGVIAPGFIGMQASLLNVTNRSLQGAAHVYGNELGRDSASAIQQGAWFAARGVIEHCLHAAGRDSNERRYLSGGDAELLLPALDQARWQHRPHLVLEGLLALALASH